MSGLVALRRAGIVAVAAYLLCGVALAQMPGIPGTGSAAPAKASAKPAVGDSPASDAALVTELRSRLATETRQLEILDADESAGAPPGTDKRSLQMNHVRVAVMVRTLTQHLIDIEKLADARERRQIVADELKTWAGLTEKPPYSILLADRLRAEHLAAQADLEALQAHQALLQQTTAALHDRYKEAESQLRQITEKAERARTESAQAKFDWERNAASLLVRLGKALVSHHETKRLLIDEELAIAQVAGRTGAPQTRAGRHRDTLFRRGHGPGASFPDQRTGQIARRSRTADTGSGALPDDRPGSPQGQRIAQGIGGSRR